MVSRHKSEYLQAKAYQSNLSKIYEYSKGSKRIYKFFILYFKFAEKKSNKFFPFIWWLKWMNRKVKFQLNEWSTGPLVYQNIFNHKWSSIHHWLCLNDLMHQTNFALELSYDYSTSSSPVLFAFLKDRFPTRIRISAKVQVGRQHHSDF